MLMHYLKFDLNSSPTLKPRVQNLKKIKPWGHATDTLRKVWSKLPLLLWRIWNCEKVYNDSDTADDTADTQRAFLLRKAQMNLWLRWAKMKRTRQKLLHFLKISQPYWKWYLIWIYSQDVNFQVPKSKYCIEKSPETILGTQSHKSRKLNQLWQNLIVKHAFDTREHVLRIMNF